MKKSIYDRSYRVLTDWLRQERQASKITMRDMSEVLGVPHTWISKVETGERRLDVLEYARFCKAAKLDALVGLKLVVDSLEKE